ncbi:hypothetical protein [Anabaenopsis elenkinii]|uniref:Uncharacterized protein n=1 Tax=Anabaenopsis elenkinii CCIBt3563 TaxID=2779889 RepID=A0A7S6U3I4_9CYAN|nr:hypothetical protein [Anabaenopsis elenkinii]QOV22396.1 hypothetical protein IM676_17255 [Anabaenopsis elenkinii CCIBt3563]
MSIWILTTGNSDIMLKHDKNWSSLYSQIRYDLECTEFAPLPLDSNDKSAGYTLPARVLGLVYENQIDDYDSDLKFPLIDTYTQYLLEAKIKLEKIIVLLTDQKAIFQEDQIIYEKCPYWQDTYTLKPLLKWYLQKQFACEIEFLVLSPTNQNNKGVDNWNETLSLVKEQLYQLNYSLHKPVYISHQAGTPAISSAVQFISLGRFANVKFLISNEYFDDNYQKQSKAEAIESSNYWRGMQIEKAKQLIKSGFPGAALKLLDNIEGIDETAIGELKKIVDFFNLHSPLTDSSQDFTIPQATQRIVDTLELVGFFFKQKNYLQGITLLAAAQETFLKVAILSRVATINQTVNFNGSSHQVSKFLVWTGSGLFLDKSVKYPSVDIKVDILEKLKFPVTKFSLVTDYDFQITNKNSGMIAWLSNIDNNFPKWPLLVWYCRGSRNTDDDLRNQLMHNLRGVEDRELIAYLSAGKECQSTDVMKVYTDYVKQPFLTAINYFNLPYNREKLVKRLQEIADSL